MPYPTIASPKTTTGTSFGGDVPNQIQRLLNNFDIADVDASNKPTINTDFRFRNQRLHLFAGASNFVIKHKTNTLPADSIVTYPANLNTGATENEFVFAGLAQTLSLKGIDADSNSLTNIRNANIASNAAIAKSKLAALAIVDADIAAGAAIASSKLAEGSAFLKNTADNALGAHYINITKMTPPGNPGTNTFNIYVDIADDKLKKKNSSGTVKDLEPTVPATLNDLTDTTIATPTNDQVLTYETASSQWKNKSLVSERVGSGTAAGGSTAYQIQHNLGSNPYNVIIQCSSHNIGFTWTKDATNINVTFASAPVGTVTFHWRVVA